MRHFCVLSFYHRICCKHRLTVELPEVLGTEYTFCCDRGIVRHKPRWIWVWQNHKSSMDQQKNQIINRGSGQWIKTMNEAGRTEEILEKPIRFYLYLALLPKADQCLDWLSAKEPSSQMKIWTQSVLSRQCDWGLFLGTVRLGEVSLSAEGLTAVLERMEVRGNVL